jgi:hypothetical protein
MSAFFDPIFRISISWSLDEANLEDVLAALKVRGTEGVVPFRPQDASSPVTLSNFHDRTILRETT